MKGVSAVIATILMLMITIAMAGLAYMYISGIFTAKTGVVLEIDATATSCSVTTIKVYVRNTGTIQTSDNLVKLSGMNSQGVLISSVTCNSTAATTSMSAGGGSIPCGSTLAGAIGTNTIIVSGPSNTVRGTVYCSG